MSGALIFSAGFALGSVSMFCAAVYIVNRCIRSDS